MAAIGHVIVGDKLYGMNEDEFIRRRKNPESFEWKMVFNRHALHCTCMRFSHPYTGKVCTISAPLPDDMRKFMQSIENE